MRVERTPEKIAAELQLVAARLQLSPLNVDTQAEYETKKKELIEAQHNERLALQQRAYINWLTKGDQGTRFFTQAIKAR